MFKNKIFILICLLLTQVIFVACSGKIDLAVEKEAMLNTDRKFSEMSVEKGSAEAFYFYLAEDGKALPQKGEPRTKQDYKKLTELAKNQEINLFSMFIK